MLSKQPHQAKEVMPCQFNISLGFSVCRGVALGQQQGLAMLGAAVAGLNGRYGSCELRAPVDLATQV